MGNIEGAWKLAGHALQSLSAEYLVDCDGTHDDKHADCGVFGGWPYLAYQFVISSGKADREPGSHRFPLIVPLTFHESLNCQAVSPARKTTHTAPARAIAIRA